MEKRFTAALLNAADQCKRLGYNPSYFLRMVSGKGGVATAKQLINSPTISDGFARLWEMKCLGLTVEAIAVQPELKELFTSEELAAAERRLDEFG